MQCELERIASYLFETRSGLDDISSVISFMQGKFNVELI